jgi:hypothetical protein
MKRIYTTAQGKQIDIERLQIANEEAIAVGNMKVNARGDKLGFGGRVVETRNQTQDSYYKLSSSIPQEISVDHTEKVVQQQIRSGARMAQGTPLPEPTPEVPVIEESTVEPTTTENPTPQLRGSLAASISAPTVHKQELIKDPRKPVGPARIG